MGSHEKESESGLLESLTLADFQTASEYLAARYALRTRLGIYGGFCLLIGILGFISCLMMLFDSKESAGAGYLIFPIACLFTAIGVIIIWFPSPKFLLIISLIQGTLGLVGIVLIIHLSAETDISGVGISFGGGGSLLVFLGACELYRIYLVTRDVFNKMPTAETMEQLLMIKRELVQAASESSPERCFIRFDETLFVDWKWFGKLYSNAACFLALNDPRGRPMLIEERKRIGIDEPMRWKNGKFVTAGLIIGQMNIPTRMPVRDFEILQAWIEAQNTQNNNDVK